MCRSIGVFLIEVFSSRLLTELLVLCFRRSSVSVNEYGEDFCSKVYAKYGDFLIYCYACDSDLCNNGNMWRPIERWFWIRSSAGASDLNIGWMSFLCGLTIVLLELCYPIGWCDDVPWDRWKKLLKWLNEILLKCVCMPRLHSAYLSREVDMTKQVAVWPYFWSAANKWKKVGITRVSTLHSRTYRLMP